MSVLLRARQAWGRADREAHCVGRTCHGDQVLREVFGDFGFSFLPANEFGLISLPV